MAVCGASRLGERTTSWNCRMIKPMWFTRVQLDRSAPIRAVVSTLLPTEGEHRASAGHQLLWTLFGDSEGRKRDFLWREADDGWYYILSARAPVDAHQLFRIEGPKEFAPRLRAGDRLRFELRANATIARKQATGTRGVRSDIVMHAIYDFPKGARAVQRHDAVQAAGRTWLMRQAESSGFRLPVDNADGDPDVAVTTYRQYRLRANNPASRIGVIDFSGLLEVTDAQRFLEQLGVGYGRAKAFGCGLMLIRRA